MSLGLAGVVRPRRSFPRVSGDEPDDGVGLPLPLEFSPRERG